MTMMMMAASTKTATTMMMKLNPSFLSSLCRTHCRFLSTRQLTLSSSSCLATRPPLAQHQLMVSCRRQQPVAAFSTTTTTTTTNTTTTTTTPPPAAAAAAVETTTNKNNQNEKKNVFLDNLGSFFLAGLGLFVVTLTRSFQASRNRNALRDQLTILYSLDPLEIDDLRTANDEMTLPIFRQILERVVQDCQSQQQQQSGNNNAIVMTYLEFVSSVRRIMKEMKGESFTIQLGHLWDRVVLDALAFHNQLSTEPQPIAFFLTALALTLHAPVPERILALYDILQETNNTKNSGNNSNKKEQQEIVVTLQDVRSMIGYLQDTCQIVPEAQITEKTGSLLDTYPVQQYERGRVGELLEWGGAKDKSDKEDENKTPIDVDAFADILKSRAVCAWGECYHRRKNV